MQWVKLEVVALIKPSADKVIEPEAGPAGKRKGTERSTS
jgi:hypothetical protein